MPTFFVIFIGLAALMWANTGLWQMVLILGLLLLAISFKRKKPRPVGNGFHGILNNAKRPPLTDLQVKKRLVNTMLTAQRNFVAQKQDRPRPLTQYELIDAELVKLILKWRAGEKRPISDDELRSLDIIRRAVSLHKGEFSELRPEDAAIVIDMTPINDIRLKVSAFVNSQQAQDRERKKWLEEIGSPDASHLLKEGWVAFLQSLDGPDVDLWHSVATDMHGLFGDRLDAAFWIMEQPECDQTTVWSFLMGILGYEVLHSEMRISDDRAYKAKHVLVPKLDQTIARWNSGFYAFHGVTYDDNIAYNEFIDASDEANDRIDELNERFGLSISPLERLDFDKDNLTHDLSHSYPSPFSFTDNEGLELNYPHRWPERLTV